MGNSIKCLSHRIKNPTKVSQPFDYSNRKVANFKKTYQLICSNIEGDSILIVTPTQKCITANILRAAAAELLKTDRDFRPEAETVSPNPNLI